MKTFTMKINKHKFDSYYPIVIGCLESLNPIPISKIIPESLESDYIIINVDFHNDEQYIRFMQTINDKIGWGLN